MAIPDRIKSALCASKPDARRAILVFGLLLSSIGAMPAHAADCSDYPNGVLDGAMATIAPSQLKIDRNCTIRNYPAANPLPTNFSFQTQPGQTDERWLVVFDNVVHTGQMACNSVAGHKIWFTNGSSTSIKEGCQNLLIPVEKIDKRNPPGQITAAVGVPFTYSLTMPVLFDPATDTVINTTGSVNDLHGVTLTDDLNATGVDLSYVSHVAYWLDTSVAVPHTFDDFGGVLTFGNFPIVDAGRQIVIELTVVLDDTPANVVGTQFVNTAKWEFGRLIDDQFYQPLPGEWGISPPLTIAGPDLTLSKSGPATLNLGEPADFGLDVQNVGGVDAWNVTLVDRMPDGPNGGTCDITPTIESAQVFLGDGVTPAPGKPPLVPGVDIVAGYVGAPACELTLQVLTAAGTIGPGERLIVVYRTELDSNSQDGVVLTNVAGAIEWFNGDSGNPNRQTFTRTLTNGTPGTADHEDAHTVAASLSGFFFEKTVANLTTNTNPTTTGRPGDTLRYTIRLRTTDTPFNGVTVRDDLGALNVLPVFEPGTLTIVPGTLPPGADASGTDPNAGTSGAGLLDVAKLSVAANSEIEFQFDVTLAATVIDGAIVLNQADLIDGAKIADSDDPNVGGQASPDIVGDEDPTRVVVQAVPPSALIKARTQPTASIGEPFAYRITVPAEPHTAPLYDVRILDHLGFAAADLRLVGISKVAGSGSWTPVNTSISQALVIEDPVDGIDIPTGEQIVIDLVLEAMNSATNVAGLTFINVAWYTYNQLDNDDSTQLAGHRGVSEPMTIVEPVLRFDKRGPGQMRVGLPGIFSLDAYNAGGGTAYTTTLTDRLPDTPQGGMCDTTPGGFTAQLFETDGVTPAAPPLVEGTDFAVAFSGQPDCEITVDILTPAGAIDPGRRLIVRHQAFLDADTETGLVLTNVAGATRYFSADVSVPNDQAREYQHVLTNGTVGTDDHQDAQSTLVYESILIFDKTVVNVTTGEDPATVATPGDRLRYRLRVENANNAPLDGFSIVDEIDRLNAIPAFVPGSLALVSVPDDADSSATDASGGAAGTGLLDVRNLRLMGLGDSVEIEFEIELAPVYADDTVIYNQSEIRFIGMAIAASDDPNINGAADPNVGGDEDPTAVRIESAPYFELDKVSTYLGASPDALLAGETLRYTITAQNTGTENANGVMLRDLVPANTTYVAGSTTLNGASVADASGGGAPLADGVAINAPQDGTPGSMNAAVTDNVATITFDVVVSPVVPNGTIISNQAFLSASNPDIGEVPSDDPRTPVVDDPTQDVVGNYPLLFAPKQAALEIDLGTPGIVDPGDVLRYTITVYNNGNVPATAVELVDGVPANTTYVPDSVTLNGLPVGQPDSGVFPLIDGIAIGSTDTTPPLPDPGAGTVNAGQSAVVQFDLKVDDAVPTGTLITNQAVVYSAETPNLLTDGDGNPATGPEPTVVVVGDAQQLAIVKEVSVVGGGPALPGGTLEYVVTATNIGVLPALYVTITDDLSMPIPGYLSYVDQSATMNGQTGGVSFAGTILTADYFSQYGPLPPGETATLRFRTTIAPDLAEGTTLANTAQVTWNDPPQWAEATVAIDVGAYPDAGRLSGTVWHDANHDDLPDVVERPLEGWSVDLLLNGTAVRTVLTDADGYYLLGDVPPNAVDGESYSLRFRAPGATSQTALLGTAASPYVNGLQSIDNIVVFEGSNLVDLNMPIDPHGVIYDSMSRKPIAGATVTLVDIRTGVTVPPACFDDPNQQGQVTVGNGYYKFATNFSDPACPSGLSYLIRVTPPDVSYIGGVSELIPPTSDETTEPFDVPLCAGSIDDAVPGTSDYCEALPSEFAPAPSVPAQSPGTKYHFFLKLDGTRMPGSAELFNNHIPLDPRLTGAVAVTKTTPVMNVTRGQVVPYVITARNTFGAVLDQVSIVDRFPPGFRYVAGSARLDGVKTEPTLVGRELTWSGLLLDVDERRTIKLLLAIGAGVTEGEFVNRAQAVHPVSRSALSNEAEATVRLVPDPTFDCTDVTGKVFDDHNRNGAQDAGETGLAGVRLVTARGLAATTDAHGRYHITCASTPHDSRGSNFVLKLDDRTLPSGFRPSTRPVQVQRATRGKTLRINFGASIHHVVGLDVAGVVFEPGTAEMRPQWRPRMSLLLEQLKKAPAVLRLSYVADREPEALVEQRLDAIKRQVMTAWQAEDNAYELVIEPEIFWRLGGPPGKGEERVE